MISSTTDNNLKYCLVVGSRTFDDFDRLESELDAALEGTANVVIVSGGAKGADSLAEKYADKKGYEKAVFKANWKQYGRAAGPKRNEEMQQFISQFDDRLCVAFWDGKSKGTASNFTLAKKYNNPLKIVKF